MPLSDAWLEERVVLALEDGSVTTRNLRASGIARLGFGLTRDVVIIDGAVDRIEDVGAVRPSIVDACALQAGWDARSVPADVVVLLRPSRILAWREANELVGRTLMRDGRWLV